MSEWISVEDRLPADDEFVFHDGWFCICYWNGDYGTNGWRSPDAGRDALQTEPSYEEDPATHWFTPPEPPK